MVRILEFLGWRTKGLTSSPLLIANSAIHWGYHQWVQISVSTIEGVFICQSGRSSFSGWYSSINRQLRMKRQAWQSWPRWKHKDIRNLDQPQNRIWAHRIQLRWTSMELKKECGFSFFCWQSVNSVLLFAWLQSLCNRKLIKATRRTITYNLST